MRLTPGKHGACSHCQRHLVFWFVCAITVVIPAISLRADDPSRKAAPATSQPAGRRAQSHFTNESALTAADREVIAWFDSLGYPNLTNRKLVRVKWVTGLTEGNKKTYRPEFGFLLADDARGSTVFTQELYSGRIDKPFLDSPFSETGLSLKLEGTVDPKFLDLEQEALRTLADSRAPPDPNESEHTHFDLSRVYSKRIHLLVMARGCAANGLPGIAHDLLMEACRFSDFSHRGVPSVEMLLDVLKSELSREELSGHVAALSCPEISRSRLLDQFRTFVKRHPRSKELKKAQEYNRILELMVKEDEAHAKQPQKALDKQTADEQIAELIYQLRDQNGTQITNPGGLDIFNDDRDGGGFGFGRKGKGSPASQLVEWGYDAVPQLLQHLDDPRLTRSAGHGRTWTTLPPVSVGYCAFEILNRIAGTYPRSPFDAEAGKMVPQTREWWTAILKQD